MLVHMDIHMGDIGNECNCFSDNTPANWRVFFSKSCSQRRYVNTGSEWLVFPTEQAMDSWTDKMVEDDIMDEEVDDWPCH
jgi:hypothetical protein